MVPNAVAKRSRKGADWIIANDVSGDVMGGDKNRIHLISEAGTEDWPEMTKTEVGVRLAQRIAEKLAYYAKRLNYPLPRLLMEPGRSMVATAGLTLYSVGSMKDVPGLRKYVAVDGGMGDNIRPALYQAQFST